MTTKTDLSLLQGQCGNRVGAHPGVYCTLPVGHEPPCVSAKAERSPLGIAVAALNRIADGTNPDEMREWARFALATVALQVYEQVEETRA